LIVVLLQNNNNQMEFGTKMASGLSGKKWDKAMKNYLLWD
jgi:lysyl-tRNA synthetase class 2